MNMNAQNKPPVTLRVVIVNRNSGDLLAVCLRHLESSEKNNFSFESVVVVNDDSTDESAEHLTGHEFVLRIIKNQERKGYSHSCNLGAAGFDGDFLLFLNTDIMVNPDSIEAAVRVAHQQEKAGVAIVGIQLLKCSGSVDRCCSRFPKLWTYFNDIFGLEKLSPKIFPGLLMSDWDHSRSRVVDQVMGAFFLVRYELFVKLKGYDEDFFVYGDDLEFAYRAYLGGSRCFYSVESNALHIGGATARKNWRESLFFSAKAKVLFGNKYFPRAQRWLLYVGIFVLEPVTRIIYFAIRLKWSQVRDNMHASMRLWNWLCSERRCEFGKRDRKQNGLRA